MPLLTLIKDRAYDDEEIARMTAAYQCALTALGIKDRSDPVTRLIAETLISIADGGVRDEKLLCERTIAALRNSNA